MCLVVIAWRVHPEAPLVVAGNRDEFHARPAAAADWWVDRPGVLGGRDLEAGGSWLAAHRDGRWAVVTNYREPTAARGAESRGKLVVDAVTTDLGPRDWIGELRGRSGMYGGYNLVVGDRDGLHFASNRGADRLDLPPGVYVLSNGELDAPWPKIIAAKRRLRRLLEAADFDADRLIDLLADRRIAPDDQLPRTGVPLELERRLSAAFIVGADYGTRASTVLIHDADGRTTFTERRFGPNGAVLGESVVTLPWPPIARRRRL